MSRQFSGPDLPPVCEFPIAPHRYRYDEAQALDAIPNPTWRQVRENAPYQAGEVVYVVAGDSYNLAYIVRVSAARGLYDDLRETYVVRPATKQGRWAKREYIAHPGYIQRGYHRAGLAPEIPKEFTE